MAVSQAAFTFIYRFMANHTAEAPEGILSRDVLKSFMSITGSDANPVWTFGHEKIPNNWYRRNTADAYTVSLPQRSLMESKELCFFTDASTDPLLHDRPPLRLVSGPAHCPRRLQPRHCRQLQ